MNPKRLLWIDGFAGLIVGIGTCVLTPWLSELYRLPWGLIVVIAFANLAYASFSLSLAASPARSKAFIVCLVIANAAWMVNCLVLAWLFASSASFFGLAHLIGEGFFVGGLAWLEWHWRADLVSR